jgi:transcriptional regulator with XRE-family HTH domain
MSRPTPKALPKAYRTTSEMLQDLGTPQDIIESVKDVENQEAVNILVSMRVAEGLTQKELADMLGCTQSRISKLEQGRDEDLRIKDFLDYTRATGEAVWITVGTPTISETVKLHIRAIRRLLEELVKLPGEDRAIRDGISRFLDEILIETGKLVQSTKLALSSKQQPEKAELEIIALGSTKEPRCDEQVLALPCPTK